MLPGWTAVGRRDGCSWKKRWDRVILLFLEHRLRGNLREASKIMRGPDRIEGHNDFPRTGEGESNWKVRFKMRGERFNGDLRRKCFT